MTRKVETEAPCSSPAPGGAAEDLGLLLPVDTNNNNSEVVTAASGHPHCNSDNSNSGSHSDTSSNNSADCGSVVDDAADAKACLKYALRPRSLQHRSHLFDDGADIECDSPPPAARRNTSASERGGARRNHKPRLLSRYRRKNANARERGRMRQINVAFEALKGVLPSVTSARGGGSPRAGPGGGGAGGGATTLTKITTLRLAAGYIQALQDILDADERGEAPDDAGSAYSWLLSSLLQEDEDEEALHQQEETNDHNAWALPYFINQGKRSLPTEVNPKMESPWPCGGTMQQGTLVDPPLKRLKHEPQHEYSEVDIDESKVTFIYTETAGLELEHLGPYPTITESDTINLLLDQKTNTIPSYDAILV